MIPSTFFKLAFDFAYALGVARSYILHGCRLFIEPRGKRGSQISYVRWGRAPQDFLARGSFI